MEINKKTLQSWKLPNVQLKNTQKNLSIEKSQQKFQFHDSHLEEYLSFNRKKNRFKSLICIQNKDKTNVHNTEAYIQIDSFSPRMKVKNMKNSLKKQRIALNQASKVMTINSQTYKTSNRFFMPLEKRHTNFFFYEFEKQEKESSNQRFNSIILDEINLKQKLLREKEKALFCDQLKNPVKYQWPKQKSRQKFINIDYQMLLLNKQANKTKTLTFKNQKKRSIIIQPQLCGWQLSQQNIDQL